jgi:hydroxyethylthiazole kinase-like uncharacterized protein yjeF
MAAKKEKQQDGLKAKPITRTLLRRMALPEPDSDGDKEERGRVLVVGGSTQIPGAAILAGVAALRAGAGKLQIATCRSMARGLALAVPESRVFPLNETEAGDISRVASKEIIRRAEKVEAVLLGPGWSDNEAAINLGIRVLPNLSECSVVVDAMALIALNGNPSLLEQLNGHVVLTPHAGEMAGLMGLSKEEVQEAPARIAVEAARTFKAVVALKGHETFIASPDRDLVVNRAGNVGLATSGSGDVLAGLVAGFLARGTEPFTAAVWGVHVHAVAGDRLAKKIGMLGYLARELLGEVPVVMEEFRGK